MHRKWLKKPLYNHLQILAMLLEMKYLTQQDLKTIEWVFIEGSDIMDRSSSELSLQKIQQHPNRNQYASVVVRPIIRVKNVVFKMVPHPLVLTRLT